MNLIYLFTYCFLLTWTCMAGDNDIFQDDSNHRHEITSNMCSFDPIFEKENPCDSQNVDSVCLVPDTGKIRKCIPMTFQAALHTSNMSKVLESVGIKCRNFSYPVNATVELLVLCKDFPVDYCPGEDHSSRESCNSRKKRQMQSAPQLDSDAYYASCENCDIILTMILDEEKDEVPVIELRSRPLEEEEERMISNHD